jgi:hypothetical protein
MRGQRRDRLLARQFDLSQISRNGPRMSPTKAMHRESRPWLVAIHEPSLPALPPDDRADRLRRSASRRIMRHRSRKHAADRCSDCCSGSSPAFLYRAASQRFRAGLRNRRPQVRILSGALRALYELVGQLLADGFAAEPARSAQEVRCRAARGPDLLVLGGSTKRRGRSRSCASSARATRSRQTSTPGCPWSPCRRAPGEWVPLRGCDDFVRKPLPYLELLQGYCRRRRWRPGPRPLVTGLAGSRAVGAGRGCCFSAYAFQRRLARAGSLAYGGGTEGSRNEPG